MLQAYLLELYFKYSLEVYILPVNIFKKLIISEKKENALFSVYNPFGVKLLTHLRLDFSHLNKYKFRHGFKDT